jgi:hypothetical protein
VERYLTEGNKYVGGFVGGQTFSKCRQVLHSPFLIAYGKYLTLL